MEVPFFSNRFITIYLIIAVTFSGLLPSGFAQMEILGPKSLRISRDPSAAELLREIRISPELGTIRVRQKGRGPFLIIHIQDAHAVPEAQKSTEKILTTLHRNYGISAAYLEGADGALDPLLFQTYPDKKKLRKVFQSYLESGELSGAAAASIFLSGMDFEGVEDWKTYEEGIHAFNRALEAQPALEKILNQRGEALELQKEKIYSKEMLELDRVWKAWQSDLALIGGLLNQLARLDSKRFESFPHLAAIRQVIQDEEKGQNTSLKILKKVQPIQGEKFFAELKECLQIQKARLLISSEQKKLDAEDRELELLRKLVRFELSFEEWQIVKHSAESREHSAKPKISVLYTLSSMLSAYLKFYKNAEARNHILLERTLSRMRANRQSAAVLVTGGFHTEYLSHELKEKEISYLEITPAISSMPKENHYSDFMRGEVSWKKYFDVKDGEINLYDAFIRAASNKLLDHGSSLLENHQLSTMNDQPDLLRHWRDNLLRALAARGEVDRASFYTRFLDEIAPKPDAMQLAALKQEWLRRIDRYVSRLQPAAVLTQKSSSAPYTAVASLVPGSFIRSEIRSNIFDNPTSVNLGQLYLDGHREVAHAHYGFALRILQTIDNEKAQRLKKGEDWVLKDEIERTLLWGHLAERWGHPDYSDQALQALWKVLSLLKRAPPENPSVAKAVNFYAKILQAKGDNPQALDFLEGYRDILPFHPHLSNSYASLLMHTGDYERAIIWLSQVYHDSETGRIGFHLSKEIQEDPFSREILASALGIVGRPNQGVEILNGIKGQERVSMLVQEMSIRLLFESDRKYRDVALNRIITNWRNISSDPQSDTVPILQSQFKFKNGPRVLAAELLTRAGYSRSARHLLGYFDSSQTGEPFCLHSYLANYAKAYYVGAKLLEHLERYDQALALLRSYKPRNQTRQEDMQMQFVKTEVSILKSQGKLGEALGRLGAFEGDEFRLHAPLEAFFQAHLASIKILKEVGRVSEANRLLANALYRFPLNNYFKALSRKWNQAESGPPRSEVREQPRSQTSFFRKQLESLIALLDASRAGDSALHDDLQKDLLSETTTPFSRVLVLKPDTLLSLIPENQRPKKDPWRFIFVVSEKFISMTALYSNVPAEELILAEGPLDYFEKDKQRRATDVRPRLIPKLAEESHDVHQGVSYLDGLHSAIWAEAGADRKGVLQEWTTALTLGGKLGQSWIVSAGSGIQAEDIQMIRESFNQTVLVQRLTMLGLPPAVEISSATAKGSGTAAALLLLVRHLEIQKKFFQNVDINKNGLRVNMLGSGEVARSIETDLLENNASVEIHFPVLADRTTILSSPNGLPHGLVRELNTLDELGQRKSLSGVKVSYIERYSKIQEFPRAQGSKQIFQGADVLVLASVPNSFSEADARILSEAPEESRIRMVVEATPASASTDAIRLLSENGILFVPFSTSNIGLAYLSAVLIRPDEYHYDNDFFLESGITERTVANLWGTVEAWSKEENQNLSFPELVVKLNDQIIQSAEEMLRNVQSDQKSEREDSRIASVRQKISDRIENGMPPAVAVRMSVFREMHAELCAGVLGVRDPKAAQAIRKKKIQELVQILLTPAYGNEGEQSRRIAAYLLGHIDLGDLTDEEKAPVIQALEKALNDRYYRIRANASKSLGKIQDPKGFLPLIDRLSNPEETDPKVQDWIRWALNQIVKKHSRRLVDNELFKSKAELYELEVLNKQIVDKVLVRVSNLVNEKRDTHTLEERQVLEGLSPLAGRYREIGNWDKTFWNVLDQNGLRQDIQNPFLALGKAAMRVATIEKYLSQSSTTQEHREAAEIYYKKALTMMRIATQEGGPFALTVERYIGDLYLELQNFEKAREAFMNVFLISRARNVFRGSGVIEADEQTLLLFGVARIQAIKNLLLIRNYPEDVAFEIAKEFNDYLVQHTRLLSDLSSLDQIEQAKKLVLGDYQVSNHRRRLNQHARYANDEPFFRILILLSMAIYEKKPEAEKALIHLIGMEDPEEQSHFLKTLSDVNHPAVTKAFNNEMAKKTEEEPSPRSEVRTTTKSDWKTRLGVIKKSPGVRIEYQLRRKGKMSRTYRVLPSNRGSGKRQILKVYDLKGRDSKIHKAQFEREFKAYRMIKASNSIPREGKAFNFNHDLGMAGFLLDEAKGQKLSRWARGKKPDQILRVMLEILKVLQQIHKKGLVFVELKPDHIYVSHDRSLDRYYITLLDFGSALKMKKTIASEENLSLSEKYSDSSFWIHHLNSERVYPAPSMDLYSLGLVLWELVLGENRSDLDQYFGSLREWREEGGSDVSQRIWDLGNIKPDIKVNQFSQDWVSNQAFASRLRQFLTDLIRKKYDSAEAAKNELEAVSRILVNQEQSVNLLRRVIKNELQPQDYQRNPAGIRSELREALERNFDRLAREYLRAQNLTAIERQRDYEAGQPDYREAFKQKLGQTLKEFSEKIATSQDLNLSFVVPAFSDPDIQGWIIRLLKKVSSKAERDPGSRVRVNLGILVAEENGQNGRFLKQLKGFELEGKISIQIFQSNSKGASPLLRTSLKRGLAPFEVNQFLALHPNALFLSPDPELIRQMARRHQAVDAASSITPEAAFALFVQMLLRAAEVSEIDPKWIQDISREFPAYLDLAGGYLTIRERAREIIFQAEAGRIISTNA